MKIKLFNKKDKNKSRALKQKESITVKEDTAEITKKERNIFQIPGFQEYNALMKLRIVVSVIFFLCTIAMIILILVDNWWIFAVLCLIGYVLLFILMIKLFITKKL
jgi:fatty acid desaturase